MRRRTFAGLGLTALLSAQAALGAQEQGVGFAGEPAPSAVLTLDDALRLARAHSPGYLQSANDEGPAAWAVRSAWTDFLPTFELEGELGYRGPGTQNFLTTAFEQSSATIASAYGATVGWQLSAERLLQPGLARARRDAVRAESASALRDLERDVTGRYLAALGARAELEAQRAQVEVARRTLELTRARFEVGQVTRLDVRGAQVALGQAEVEALRLEQAERVTRLALFELMGVEPPGDPLAVELADSFPVRPLTRGLEELQAMALARNPELTSLEKRAEAAGWESRAAYARYLPTLSLSAGWSGFTQELTDPDPLIAGAVDGERARARVAVDGCMDRNAIVSRLADPLPTADCSGLIFTPEREAELVAGLREANDAFPYDFTRQPFQARLVISIPVFNGVQREKAIVEARAEQEDARLAARARELGLRSEVARRYYSVERGYREIGIQAANREAAADQRELAAERYRLGRGDFQELLQAQLTASQAERDHVAAVYAYHEALAALEALVATPLR